MEVLRGRGSSLPEKWDDFGQKNEKGKEKCPCRSSLKLCLGWEKHILVIAGLGCGVTCGTWGSLGGTGGAAAPGALQRLRLGRKFGCCWKQGHFLAIYQTVEFNLKSDSLSRQEQSGKNSWFYDFMVCFVFKSGNVPLIAWYFSLWWGTQRWDNAQFFRLCQELRGKKVLSLLGRSNSGAEIRRDFLSRGKRSCLDSNFGHSHSSQTHARLERGFAVGSRAGAGAQITFLCS